MLAIDKKNFWFGLSLSCDSCVLPMGYSGLDVKYHKGQYVCKFCQDHKSRSFTSAEGLIKDLDLKKGEKIGITVSGGKDSLFAWMKLVEILGKDRVIAFNHQKVGLVHPMAEENLARAREILATDLVRVPDLSMLPRFQRNLQRFLSCPDAAMIKVVFCAGCRYGIQGQMFRAGLARGVTKFVNASSYLEQSSFKVSILKDKGGGDYKRGLLQGLAENGGYFGDDTVEMIKFDHGYCQTKNLFPKYSLEFYSKIQSFNFDRYYPNIPDQNERIVKGALSWQRPERGWHFDCMIESFKDLFYYGILGYTETDCKLSSMIRYGLISRGEAIPMLLENRYSIINSKDEVLSLAYALGMKDLIPHINDFCERSPFLSK